MASYITRRDITAQADADGWTVPDGWKIWVELAEDTDGTSPVDQGPATVDAWERDEWQWVNVDVSVRDGAGREWGSATIGGCAYGWLPITGKDGATVGRMEVNPMDTGNGSSIQEYGLIGKALREAAEEVRRFGQPVIKAPDGRPAA